MAIELPVFRMRLLFTSDGYMNGMERNDSPCLRSVLWAPTERNRTHKEKVVEEDESDCNGG